MTKEEVHRRLTFKCKTGENALVMSLKYMLVTQGMLCLIILMYVATVHRLNYSRQQSKKQFVVYDSDIPLTLK